MSIRNKQYQLESRDKFCFKSIRLQLQIDETKVYIIEEGLDPNFIYNHD